MAKQERKQAREAIERANERPQDGWGCWSYTADTRILILRTFWSGPPAPRYLLLHRPSFASVPWSIGPVVFALRDGDQAASGRPGSSGTDSSDLWLVSLSTTHAEYEVVCEEVQYYEEAAG